MKVVLKTLDLPSFSSDELAELGIIVDTKVCYNGRMFLSTNDVNIYFSKKTTGSVVEGEIVDLHNVLFYYISCDNKGNDLSTPYFVASMFKPL